VKGFWTFFFRSGDGEADRELVDLGAEDEVVGLPQ